MFPKHPAPLRNFDYIGTHRYFLTWCCFERQPLFTKPLVVDLARTQILRACEPCGMSITAYCFMPDHVHSIVEGQREDSDGKRFFSLAKQFSGFAYAQVFGGRLWQRYGYEHVLRSTQTTRAVARYILENPVRAGMVTATQDWPHSGSPTATLAALIEWAYSVDGESG